MKRIKRHISKGKSMGFNTYRQVSAAYAEGKRDGMEEERARNIKQQEQRDIETYTRFVEMIEGMYSTRHLDGGIEEEIPHGQPNASRRAVSI